VARQRRDGGIVKVKFSTKTVPRTVFLVSLVRFQISQFKKIKATQGDFDFFTQKERFEKASLSTGETLLRRLKLL